MNSFVHNDAYGSKELFQINSKRLLAIIKEMIEENNAAMKINGNCHNDMLQGRVDGLRSLAIELGLCSYEELI